MGQDSLTENFLPLVVKKAKEAWLRLPPQTRSWIGLDDLIQDGLLFARQNVIPAFRKKRGASFSTYLWIALNNFYKGRTWFYYAAKRMDGRNVSLTAVHGSFETAIEDDIQAREAFTKLYSAATPELRIFLRSWFLQEMKVHVRSKRFKAARKEFRVLSSQYDLGPQEFRYLLYNDTWKLDVQRFLVEIL